MSESRLDADERRELVEDLVRALEERHAPEGTQLLELMRIERDLVDALAAIRRQIGLIVRAVEL